MRPGRYIHYVSTIKGLFWASVAFLLLNAATFLFMPMAAELSENGSIQWGLMIVGIVFWISIGLGYALLIMANLYRRDFVRNRLDGDFTMGCRMGIITFFSTRPGAIADGLFVAALIAFLIVFLNGNINGYITYVLLALLTFSLNMHGIFNGRIYKATKYKRIVRRGEDNE